MGKRVTVLVRKSASSARRRTCLAVGASALAGLIGTGSAAAAVEVPFAAQFATNVRGGVAIAANTLMTCPDLGGTETKCLEARAGTATGAALNNNAYKMERKAIDPATFDSSAATLALPAGATVEFAGLYYGARTTAGEGGGEAATNPAARGTLLFRTPAALGYSELLATVDDSTSIGGSYVGLVDVTAQVAVAGSGEYTVANVQAGTGVDRYAGWSLVVVYADPASPPRSIRVFDGLASIVANGAPLQIPVTGLETPASGTVAAEVGLVAYEGDRGAAGDRLALAGRNLADAANPENNVFNSSIATGGLDVATKNPSYVNQLGFDADLIGANGLLGNGATETTLEESTSLEQYLTQAIVVAIELDPAVLEPPAPAPPASPPSTGEGTPEPAHGPAPHHEAPHHPLPHHPGKGHAGGGGESEARVHLEVSAPEGAVRPTEVVSLRATVTGPSTAPLLGVRVCNTLPPGLTRLRAAGAEQHRNVACWHLAKLAAGERRTFITTARVDATAPRALLSRTVVSARGARTARRTSRFRVTPLPPRACGSSLSSGARDGILLRC